MTKPVYDNTYSGAAFPYVFTDTDNVRIDYTATQNIRRGEMFLADDNPSDDDGLAVFTKEDGHNLEVVITNKHNDIVAAGTCYPYSSTKESAPAWKGFLEITGQQQRVAMSVWVKELVDKTTGEAMTYHQLKRDRRQLPNQVPMSLIGGGKPASPKAANA